VVTEVFRENLFVTVRKIEARINDYQRNRNPPLLDASTLWRASVLLIGALAQLTLWKTST
jgi:hypothetical protein